MIQGNFFQDNDDLQLHFQKLINWDEVVREYEGKDFRDARLYRETGNENLAFAPASVAEAVDFYGSVLDSMGDVMGTFVAPRAAEMDRVGLKYENGTVRFPKALDECFEKVREAGLIPMALRRKYGGLSMPSTASSIGIELFSRADAAFCLSGLSPNVAEIVERYGSPELCAAWIPRLARGELTCAMALTEPNYGSDLPSVQTKAVKDEAGVWRITGTKRFITHASGYTGMPSIILTLARTGTPASGARGLSFFLVEGKDAFIAGVEKKLGLHSSPTCEVVFDNTPGLLIGEVGKGLVKYSMGMMNTARLMIAAQALGTATASYNEGRKYAFERQQFGKPIQDIPAVRKMLDRMETEIAAIRNIVMEGSRAVDLYLWERERQREEGVPEREAKGSEHRHREKLADFFTPLAKYYATETAKTIADDAIQIHGGAGYTEEYDVARLYRDVRITTIYEGTTQLQIVAAIGGVVVGLTPTGFLRNYISEEMAKFKASADLKDLFDLMERSVAVYKNIDAGDRDTRAFETVENAARFIISMLFERQVAMLTGAEQAARSVLARRYLDESRAVMTGNLVRLELAARKKAAASV